MIPRAHLTVERVDARTAVIRETRRGVVEIEERAVFVGGAWCWDKRGTLVSADVDALIRSRA